MEPNDERNSLRRAHKIAMILAAAVLASLPFYVLVVEVLRRRGINLVPGLDSGARTALRFTAYGAAVLAVIILRVLRGLILRKKPGDDPALLGQRLLRASILTTALSEVPALLGMALFLAAGLFLDFYILALVSLFLMFMFFPRYANWSDWAERAPES